jgi:hypothetical protein
MRLNRLLAAVFAAGALLVAAPGASAQSQLACNYDFVSFNACLHFTVSYLWWSGHAGLDLTMPPNYAQEVMACGPNFKAELWGDDGGPGKDDFIRPFQFAPGSPALTPTGISATADGLNILDRQMDEDDGRDELYVKFTYVDCHDPGRVHELHTGDFVGYF